MYIYKQKIHICTPIFLELRGRVVLTFLWLVGSCSKTARVSFYEKYIYMCSKQRPRKMYNTIKYTKSVLLLHITQYLLKECRKHSIYSKFIKCIHF